MGNISKAIALAISVSIFLPVEYANGQEVDADAAGRIEIRCDQNDPFEKVDCLINGYVKDDLNWSEEHERRVETLLKSPYANIDHLSLFYCFGRKKQTYLACAMAKNYRAIGVLLDNDADASVRSDEGTSAGHYLYHGYLSGTALRPSSLFVSLEASLVQSGLDPNAIGQLNRGNSEPMHFNFVRFCARGGEFWEQRFAHWRGNVRSGLYDLSLRTEQGHSFNDLLRFAIEEAKRSGEPNIQRCEGMIQLSD